MTVLVPMTAAQFPAYVEASIADYAEENVAAGRWPADGALERSRDEFAALLPQGLATPDQHVFTIQAGADGPAVGFLWFAVESRRGLRSGYVYDVGIHAPWRRQGHALRAFVALEALAAEMGLASIGLHVFGHNPGAQALYARLGYRVTGINMAKTLAPPAPPTRSEETSP